MRQIMPLQVAAAAIVNECDNMPERAGACRSVPLVSSRPPITQDMNYVAAARAAWQAWSGELDRQRAGRNREAQRRARIRAHSERELQRFARFGQEWPSLNCAAAVWQMLDHIIRRIRWWLSWPERRKTRRWLLEFNAQLARQLGDRDLCRYASGSCVSSIFQAACIAEALRRGLDVPAKELR